LGWILGGIDTPDRTVREITNLESNLETIVSIEIDEIEEEVILDITYLTIPSVLTFELKDHLGNVRATFKPNNVEDSTNMTYDIVSLADYYPGGSIMPGRKYNPGLYRYGFNGKENDNEIKGLGNHVDFGARGYDPRLGRWWSVDPLANQFASQSPYSYAGSNPVYFIDKEGEKKITYLTVIDNNGDKSMIKIIDEDKVMKEIVGYSSLYVYDKNPTEITQDYDIAEYVTVDFSQGDGNSVTTTTGELRGKERNWYTSLEESFPAIAGLVVYGSQSTNENSPGTKTDGEVYGSFDFGEFSSIMSLIGTAMKNQSENTLDGKVSAKKVLGMVNKLKSILDYQGAAVDDVSSVHCLSCKGNYLRIEGEVTFNETDAVSTDTVDYHGDKE
jgi:RHS repeat-associated protein